MGGGLVRVLILLALTQFVFANCSNLSAATFYITVAGLPGEPEYDQRFTSWAKDVDKFTRAQGAEAKVETLMGADATKAKLAAALTRVAKEAKPADAVVITMIGHGTFDQTDYKFNLPGPDITAAELAAYLDKIPAERQLVVNMTSASGGSRAALLKPGRAIITATKSGSEKNATVFARYWVEALRDPAADLDKNEVISALEAFRYAEQKTAKFYETQKRLATEHAILEDTGKGEGVKNPSAENGEGLLASRIGVARLGAAQTAASTPEKLKLLAQKEDLEQQIDALKYKKAAVPADQYRRQLSALLLELAKTQAELDR